MASLSSLQAMKQPGTPETCPARHSQRVTVLLEIFTLDVVAESEIAIEAKRKFIAKNIAPERPEIGSIPDLCYIHPGKISENPWFNGFLPPADIASITMPQEIAGVDLSIP